MHQTDHDHGKDSDYRNDTIGHALSLDQTAGTQERISIRQTVYRLSSGDNVCNTSGNIQHGQRTDHGHYIQVGDHKTIQETNYQANRNTGEHQKQNSGKIVHIGKLESHKSGNNTCESCSAAHGDINTSKNDYIYQTGCHQCINAHLGQQVQNIFH